VVDKDQELTILLPLLLRNARASGRVPRVRARVRDHVRDHDRDRARVRDHDHGRDRGRLGLDLGPSVNGPFCSYV